MTLTYTWKIDSMKIKDVSEMKPNSIVQTYWKLTGKDEDGNEGVFSGATPFTVDATDEEGPFIPFEELTEEDVISWIKSIVEKDDGYKKHINEQIMKQIEDKKNPVKDTKLPWVKEEAATPAAKI